jgi:hypothetical protein
VLFVIGWFGTSVVAGPGADSQLVSHKRRVVGTALGAVTALFPGVLAVLGLLDDMDNRVLSITFSGSVYEIHLVSWAVTRVFTAFSFQFKTSVNFWRFERSFVIIKSRIERSIVHRIDSKPATAAAAPAVAPRNRAAQYHKKQSHRHANGTRIRAVADIPNVADSAPNVVAGEGERAAGLPA